MPRAGSASSRRAAHRRRSWPSSTPRWCRRSPTRRCARDSPSSAWTSLRASSRLRKALPRSTRPKSTSGGRSSRPPTSKSNRKVKRGWQAAVAVLLALFAFFAVESLRLSLRDALGPGPGFFPFWLSVAGGVLGLLLLVQLHWGRVDIESETLKFELRGV